MIVTKRETVLLTLHRWVKSINCSKIYLWLGINSIESHINCWIYEISNKQNYIEDGSWYDTMHQESMLNEKWYDSETWKGVGKFLYEQNLEAFSDHNNVSFVSYFINFLILHYTKIIETSIFFLIHCDKYMCKFLVLSNTYCTFNY